MPHQAHVLEGREVWGFLRISGVSGKRSYEEWTRATGATFVGPDCQDVYRWERDCVIRANFHQLRPPGSVASCLESYYETAAGASSAKVFSGVLPWPAVLVPQAPR